MSLHEIIRKYIRWKLINHINENILITIKILINGINSDLKNTLKNVKIVLRILKEHGSDLRKFKICKNIKANGRYI